METTEIDDKYPEMSYFLNESKSDVIFLIDGQRIPAIKVLLSVKSKVFNAMFSGNFKESKESVIEIKDTTTDAFKVMLRFVYCEDFRIEDENNYHLVVSVCKLADRYQLKRLIDAIGEYYKSKVSINNLEIISGIAFDFDLKVLIQSIYDFIDNNFNAFLMRPTEELMKIDDSTHNSLLKIVVKNYLKTDRYLRVLMRGEYEIDINGLTYRRTGIKSGRNLFNLDKMHENN